MPWSATDYPASMKNLSPEVRRKAIEIANAILEGGGEEGTAIATAITRAKEHFEKKGSARRTARALADELAPLPEPDETQQTVSAPTGGPHGFPTTAAAEPEIAAEAPAADPEDPTIHIVGYGVLRLSQIQRGVIERLAEIVKRAQGGDWRNALALYKNGVPGAMMEALAHFQKTGIWYDVDSGSYKKLTQPREL